MLFPKQKWKKPKGPDSEAILQLQCESYLDQKMVTYVRIPNCVYMACFSSTYLNIGKKKEASRAIAGLPDLIIFGDDRYICVELKSKTGKQRQKQKAWQRRFKGNYYVVRDFETFKNLVDEL